MDTANVKETLIVKFAGNHGVGSIIKTSKGEYYIIAKNYKSTWWRRLLQKLGFKTRTGLSRLERLPLEQVKKYLFKEDERTTNNSDSH